MRSTLRLVFGPDELTVNLPDHDKPWAADEARRWLDDQFVANDCEPLRALGKVLVADKLAAIARAIGLQGFHDDEAFRMDFARAASAALARDLIKVDAETGKVTF